MPKNDDVSTFPIFQEGLFAPFLAIPAVARSAADVSGEEARIRDLLSEYCYRYDAGDVDGVVQLFTPDAVIGNATGTHRGREAIRQNYADFVAKRRFAPPYRVLTAARSSVRPAMLIRRAIPLLPELASAGSKPPEATTRAGSNQREAMRGWVPDVA